MWHHATLKRGVRFRCEVCRSQYSLSPRTDVAIHVRKWSLVVGLFNGFGWSGRYMHQSEAWLWKHAVLSDPQRHPMAIFFGLDWLDLVWAIVTSLVVMVVILVIIMFLAIPGAGDASKKVYIFIRRRLDLVVRAYLLLSIAYICKYGFAGVKVIAMSIVMLCGSLFMIALTLWSWKRSYYWRIWLWKLLAVPNPIVLFTITNRVRHLAISIVVIGVATLVGIYVGIRCAYVVLDIVTAIGFKS